MNKDSSCLIEARIEVSLKGSNVLSQMNELVIESPNIDETCKKKQQHSHDYIATQKCNMNVYNLEK